jgi:hypothetical protein
MTMTDPTRPAWLDRFIDAHGERLYFLEVQRYLLSVLLIVGIKIEALDGLVDAGTTILIGQWHVTF